MSEVEKVDKVLRVERHGAAIGVVGCARMVCVLQRRNKHEGKKKYFMVVTLEASGVAKNTVASMLSNDENSIL